MPRKCISAILWQNPAIQSSMHQIFIQIYSTVSIGLSFLESSTGFSQAPPPQTAFPYITFHYKTSSFCYLPIFSLLEPSKELKSKFAFSPLGKRSRTARLELWLDIHQYTFKLINLKHRPNINPFGETLLTFHFP